MEIIIKEGLRDEVFVYEQQALYYTAVGDVNVREGLGVKARWVEVGASVFNSPHNMYCERLPKFAFPLISRVVKRLLNGLAREAVGPKVMW